MYRKNTPKFSNYTKYAGEGFPRRIYWKKIAGPELSSIQSSDAIFDEYDYKIRQIPVPLEVLELYAENKKYYLQRQKFDQ